MIYSTSYDAVIENQRSIDSQEQRDTSLLRHVRIDLPRRSQLWLLAVRNSGFNFESRDRRDLLVELYARSFGLQVVLSLSLLPARSYAFYFWVTMLLCRLEFPLSLT